MIRTFKILLVGWVCCCIMGCGGKPELGTAQKTPEADKQKMHDEMKKSFEKGKLKGKAPKAP